MTTALEASIEAPTEYKPNLKDRLKWKWRAFTYWVADGAAYYALKLLVWLARDSNLVAHGVSEMKFSEMDVDGDPDDMNTLMARDVRDLLAVFSLQGHSGTSAPYAVNMFKTVASFGPLGPLQGTDDEWHDLGEGQWQNKRAGNVFKNETGAYDIDGRVFRDKTGCYTNGNSRVWVTFPYTPTTEYVDVDDDGNELIKESYLG